MSPPKPIPDPKPTRPNTPASLSAESISPTPRRTRTIPGNHPAKGTPEWEALRQSLLSDYFDPMVLNSRNGLLVSGQPRLVFSSSMCDIFEDHPTIEAERAKLWALIRATPNLHWQLLTKRADRIAENLPADWGTGYPNVWLGVSISEAKGIWRADYLRSIPALGPIAEVLDLTGIEWLIFGGESGPGFRPMDVQWARDIRVKCRESGTAFFFKQSAAYRTEMGIELDGQIVRAFPEKIQMINGIPA